VQVENWVQKLRLKVVGEYMNMVITTMHLKAAPEKRMNIVKTIHTMIGPTNVQPGCLHCELFSSTQNDDKLFLLEKWDSKESLDQHIKSDEFRNVMAAMDSACEPPEIYFYETNSLGGMDLLENIFGVKA
jgi:quinol monooxygenase YgiN